MGIDVILTNRKCMLPQGSLFLSDRRHIAYCNQSNGYGIEKAECHTAILCQKALHFRLHHCPMLHSHDGSQHALYTRDHEVIHCTIKQSCAPIYYNYL